MSEQVFDACVVGGGMVGAAVALGLASKGWSVAIVEPNMPEAFSVDQGPDLRVSAISQASQNLLEALGAWQHIAGMRMQVFKRLSVWENADSRTDFDAADIEASHLGHIIENRLVQLGLHQALGAKEVSWFTTRIARLEEGDPVSIALEDGNSILCRMVVGADGAQSQVRQLAGIGTQGWQYKQHAMGINIRTSGPSKDITWQEFHPSGPRAYLPLYDRYASLVWYDAPETLRALKGLSKDKLKVAVIDAFPDLLDDFDVLQCASFPLTRMHANRYVKGNIVLVGDAAHTINPLAGQGVNLGFQDVQVLLEQVPERGDIRSDSLADALYKYEQKRRNFNLLMMSAMDVMYKLFSNSIPALAWLRNIGLKVANRTGVVKHQVMRYAMGISPLR